jgi:hypothetical protein
MRIVHEVEGEMQVGCSGTPYSRALGKTEYAGYRVELVIAPMPGGEGYAEDGEVIHIEGNAKYVVQMLGEALDVVKSINGAMEEEFKKGLPVDEDICWNRWQEAKVFVDRVQQEAGDGESSELLLADAMSKVLAKLEADWRSYGTADKRLGETKEES